MFNLRAPSAGSSSDSSSESESEAPLVPKKLAPTNKRLAKLFPGYQNSGTLLNPSIHASTSSDSSKKAPKTRELSELEAKSPVLQPGFEKKDSVLLNNRSSKSLKRQRKAEREKTKGKAWFDLPATEIDEEKKRDLEFLQLRKSLDPKRFYRNNDRDVLPKYFQVGTILDNPSDFYSSRVPRKERKKTMVEELLADSEFKKFSKRKYAEIQEEQSHYRRGAFRRSKKGGKQEKKT